MARYDDLNTNMIGYATVLSCVVLVLVLQGVQALSNGMIQSESDRKIALSSSEPTEIKNAQLARLEGYTKSLVPDTTSTVEGATKEVFSLPIGEAKAMVLKEFAGE